MGNRSVMSHTVKSKAALINKLDKQVTKDKGKLWTEISKEQFDHVLFEIIFELGIYKHVTPAKVFRTAIENTRPKNS